MLSAENDRELNVIFAHKNMRYSPIGSNLPNRIWHAHWEILQERGCWQSGKVRHMQLPCWIQSSSWVQGRYVRIVMGIERNLTFWVGSRRGFSWGRLSYQRQSHFQLVNTSQAVQLIYLKGPRFATCRNWIWLPWDHSRCSECHTLYQHSCN